MTDQEIIQGLIDKDSQITEDFFFKQCKPLLSNIIYKVFDNVAEYDELVNELYLYLMENDAARLKSFGYRCSVFHWLKMLSIRYFIRIKNRGMVIDNDSHEPPYEEKDRVTDPNFDDNPGKDDLKRLIEAMPNKRYALVIKRFFIDDATPKEIADEMGIEISNLYNIKQRAIKQLTEVALKDIHLWKITRSL